MRNLHDSVQLEGLVWLELSIGISSSIITIMTIIPIWIKYETTGNVLYELTLHFEKIERVKKGIDFLEILAHRLFGVSQRNVSRKIENFDRVMRE